MLASRNEYFHKALERDARQRYIKYGVVVDMYGGNYDVHWC